MNATCLRPRNGKDPAVMASSTEQGKSTHPTSTCSTPPLAVVEHFVPGRDNHVHYWFGCRVISNRQRNFSRVMWTDSNPCGILMSLNQIEATLQLIPPERNHNPDPPGTGKWAPSQPNKQQTFLQYQTNQQDLYAHDGTSTAHWLLAENQNSYNKDICQMLSGSN